MRPLLIAVVLFAVSAAAQIAPCGSATCVGDSPGDVKLGGTVLETRGPLPDGGLAILQPVVVGAGLVLQSQQPTGTSVIPDVIIRAPNKHDGGTILSVRNGLAEVFSIGPGGITGITGVLDGGPISATTVTASASADLKFITTVGADAGSVRVQGIYVPIAAPDDGGTSMVQRIQYGYGVLSSNDYAVTFNPAFAGIPGCQCSSVNATAATCGLKAIPSASAATFRGENASDAIYWQCIGPK